MNCQECRSLVERFLDHALTGFTKRKVNLHLSRCASCRAYFDRRRENQALAYRALNAALADERLPEGFTRRFREAHITPEHRFGLFRFRKPWKVAAVLAAMVSLAGFASMVLMVSMGSPQADASPSLLDDDSSDVPLQVEDVLGANARPAMDEIEEVSVSTASTSNEKENQNMTTRRKMTAVVTAAALAAASPNLASAGNGEAYTSASYVQDGLIAQWDGIDNAGTGTHNPISAVWKDLKGSCDMTLLNNGESWVNGMALSVNGAGAAGSTAAPRYTTIEVVYKMASGACLFVSGLKWGNTEWYISRIVAFSGGTRAIFTNAHDGQTIYIPNANGDVVHSLSAIYADNNSDVVMSASMDGYVRTQNTVQTSWYDATGVVMVGDRKTTARSEPWEGEIYAIRLYDRALSVGELAANQKVDAARFGVSGWYSCISSGNPDVAAIEKSSTAVEVNPSTAIETRGLTCEWSAGIALNAAEQHIGTMFSIR